MGKKLYMIILYRNTLKFMQNNMFTLLYGFKCENGKSYIYNHTKVEGPQTQSKHHKLTLYSQNGLFDLVKKNNYLDEIQKSLPKERFLCNVILTARIKQLIFINKVFLKRINESLNIKKEVLNN